MLRIYKKPQQHTIYWAVKDVKQAERSLGGPVAYHHVTLKANCIVNYMACRALMTKGDITYMQGDVPANASPNQLEEVYAQQGAWPQLDWSALPALVAWSQRLQPPDVSVVSVFGQKWARQVQAIALS